MLICTCPNDLECPAIGSDVVCFPWCEYLEESDGDAAEQDTPTVDAVEVVRCKECKYSYADLDGLCCTYGVCIDSIVPEDFYCANGERRGGGEDG